MSATVKHAAVSLIERGDGRLLCVWNRRYGGWSLPGGLVEEGESFEEAQARELLEETGLETTSRECVYEGPSGTSDVSRAGVVHIYRVAATGWPARMIEDDCPVIWLTRPEFLQSTPFSALYTSVFKTVPAAPLNEGAS